MLYIAKEVFIEIPNKKNIVPDSSCLNNSLIFGAISKDKFDRGLSLELNPKINDNLTELFTALCDCPEHLIESAKMFFFFEHLIKHHSLETLTASTMNNIAPRADKNIKHFTSINLWYTRLDEIFDFELGAVLDAFSTTKQKGLMKGLNPPFLMDENGKKKKVPYTSGDNLFNKFISD